LNFFSFQCRMLKFVFLQGQGQGHMT
jgi:hypothetical protein